MKLAPFLSSAFFAAGICAAPHPNHGAERLARRGPSSGGVLYVGNTTIEDNPPTETTLNWAGAVLPSPTAGETFQTVTCTFTVPATGDAGSSVSIWVGINGDFPSQPVIRGGIYLSVAGDGTAVYQSWSEWVPDPPVFYDQNAFSFAAGDVVNIELDGSDTIALLTIDDATNGNSLIKQFSPSNSSDVALGQGVEWVIERVSPGNLMNFGTVLFSLCFAYTSDIGVGLSGATAMSIQNSGSDETIIAAGSILDAYDLQVTYSAP